MSVSLYNENSNTVKKIRYLVFLFVALLHLALIFFLVFKMDVPLKEPEPETKVMKLADVREDRPPPPPPPPPPKRPPPLIRQNTVEPIAESMIETDEVPEGVVDYAPVEVEAALPAVDYLPMNRVSVAPAFSEQDIRKNLVYPPIALRSGLSGMVILELFVDAQGEVQRINILKEDPMERGFGDAAVKAFMGLRAVPAEANGTPVAVRYRYPVRFAIK
jgi:protein TonB